MTVDRDFLTKNLEDYHEALFIKHAEELGEDLDQCELFFDHSPDTVRTILKTPNHGNFLMETPIR